MNGLRAEDAESYYPRRGSLESEYSILPTHDSESEQLFFKEHVRTGSKDSNISAYARRKSRAAARPETKVGFASVTRLTFHDCRLTLGISSRCFTVLRDRLRG